MVTLHATTASMANRVEHASSQTMLLGGKDRRNEQVCSSEQRVCAHAAAKNAQL